VRSDSTVADDAQCVEAQFARPAQVVRTCVDLSPCSDVPVAVVVGESCVSEVVVAGDPTVTWLTPSVEVAITGGVLFDQIALEYLSFEACDSWRRLSNTALFHPSEPLRPQLNALRARSSTSCRTITWRFYGTRATHRATRLVLCVAGCDCAHA